MTAKTIREIKFEKGEQFTTKFIKDFDREWEDVTRRIRESGADLHVPIAKG